MTRLLHITDFHISDPRGSDEVLSADGAAEYLKSLANAVYEATGDQGVDAIVATGDYVDKGRVSNFEYAQSLLVQLAENLRLPLACVATCIGNHDLVLKQAYPPPV
jgi:predicted MPP superfamily phosphohydrolase